MTRYLCIDTENTGLFVHRNPDGTVRRSHEPGQPRMAEFAAAVVNESFQIVDTFQQYILPDDTWLNADGSPMLEMPEEALKVNKLTFELLREKGAPVHIALEYYSDMLATGLIPLCFNAQHDLRQMRGELRRAHMPDLFEETPNVCVMRSINANYREPDQPNGKRGKVKIKKLNGKGGFVGLVDAAAHFKAPGYEDDKRHQALEDVAATVWVARELNKMGMLLPAAVHHARGLNEGEQS